MNLANALAKGQAVRQMRESIAGDIAATLESLQRSRTHRIDDRDLAWLALVPVWTVPLAHAAGFPGEGTNLEDLLATGQILGLVAQARPAEFVSRRIEAALHRSLDHQFWMPDTERPRVLADLRDRLGPRALLHEMGTILRRLPETGLLPALEQWRELAGLAVEGDVGRAAEQLRQVLRQHLERDETAAALAWLRTGTLLAQALGGQIDSSVMRGRRELEVAYRRSHDRRALVGFLEREEQIRSFAELVEGPDDLWATHFLGVGGAGKTMLIRHINAELAGKHQCITARVDFDYISPNYPRLRPEQLLVELADELRAHSAPDEFARFEDKVRSLQDSMRQQSPDGLAIDPLDTPEFEAVQRAFDDWLRGLKSRVVLILDTCEELAKFQPGGEMAPSIRATYRILEHLHEVLPTLRVVFAGRRPLAQAGAGWALRSTGMAEGRRHLPPKKTYLRLHLLRGFTEREVDDYFERQRVFPDRELKSVILEKSRESTALIELLGDCALRTELLAGEPTPMPRSSPFDLSLYAQWLRETPGLTAAFVRDGGTDPYIDLRIARRLTDGVRELLPAVAFLRRFDEAMLRPASRGATDAVFASNFRELAEQEWISYQHEEGGVFLEVDRNLHPRLQRYFAHSADQRRLIDEARRTLGPGLAALVRFRLSSIHVQVTTGGSETELGFDLVYAALRALDPEAAAGLWEEIEARVIVTGRWDWARTITARLLGEDEAGRIGDELRPALLATQASVIFHSEPGPGVKQAWENVIAVAAEALPSKRARDIEARAWLGKIATSRPEEITPDDVTRLTQLWEQLDGAAGIGAYSFEQIAASLFAATEPIVDGIEAGGKYGQLNVRNPATFPAQSVAPEVRSFGSTLCSRLHRDKGRRQEADAFARDALFVARSSEDSTAQRWAGWIAPESIVNFAALELLLHQRWFDEAAGMVTAAELWRELPSIPASRNASDPPPLASVDLERRISLQLELQLGSSPQEISLPLLGDLEWWDSHYKGPHAFERAAHRAVVPLVVNLAFGWLATGNIERAIALLDARTQRAKAGAGDPEMLLQCQRAKLKIISRMRLQRRGEALMERALETSELVSVGWTARALTGLPAPELPADTTRVPREQVHAWWRSRSGDDEATRRAVVKAAKQIFGRETKDGRISDATLYADFAECDWYELGGTPARWGDDLPAMLEEAIAAFRNQPTGPASELVRLNLRAAAISQYYVLPDSQLVGRRRLAELALEEGEVFGLRSPRTAVSILEIAYDNFVAVNDWRGALMAAICAATGAQRARLSALLASVLSKKVRPAYERVAAELPDELPSWAELERLTSAPLGELRRLDHPFWAGWLHRLFRCLLTEHGGGGKEQLSWIARHYGEHLPIEMGFAADEKKAARQDQRSQLREDRMFQVGIILFIVLFIGSMAAAFFAQTQMPIATGITLSVVAFCVVAFTALVKVNTALRTVRAKLILRVEPVERSPRVDVAGVRPCRWHIRTQDTAHHPTPGFPTLTPGLQRYRPASADVPFEVTDILVSTRRRLLGNAWWNRLAVPLLAPSSLASYPWEALSLLALPVTPDSSGRLARFVGFGVRSILVVGGGCILLGLGVMAVVEKWDSEMGDALLGWGIVAAGMLALFAARRARGQELHFYRGAARKWTDAQRKDAWRTRRVESAYSRKWDLVVEQGLAPFARKKFHVSASHLTAIKGTRSIYHAVGRGLSTVHGFQLEVGTKELLSEQAVMPGASQPGLLGCEEMRARDALITIIQGEPLTERNPRSQSDRESAALLRALGGALFAAGAEAVIVLPSLHAPLAEAALSTLSRKLAGSGTPSLPRMLDAITNVRATIRDWPAPPTVAANASDLEWFKHDQLEAALDVCLFARTDLPAHAAEPSTKA